MRSWPCLSDLTCLTLVPTPSSSHAPPAPTPAGRFSLLTYNLLADLYAKSDIYNHVPAWTMAWHYRKRNLLAELLSSGADVLCLQEVQSDHYADFLQPELHAAGYNGIYKRKVCLVCVCLVGLVLCCV